MKNIIKVLIFVLILVGIGYLLFNSFKDVLLQDDPVNPDTQQVIKPNQNTTTNPETLTTKDAFENTSNETNSVEESGFTCDMAEPIIHNFYALRLEDKPLEDAIKYMEENPEIPADFKTFAEGLWNTPKEKLEPEDKVVDSFIKSCSKLK
ncbi:hypothetical protein [Taylorella equigenitalis]|uniref:Uncharacterized protein n=3 Tax=Taylorella equigenitalis TaxID=29575 RepID=A0A654KI00_TAYEM|nr:hypothetical protein [Taylorella equigenitalis]ADU92071.1 hypothetical protein TEQUI_1147 [Taylorella equigenitalis MCE9]AFN35632.1 putative membrane protein [Taylorella equigenitalis ATCC 35865]ASY30284.1 hypothetical protein B9Z30_02610 [Taylorella equigenitalis]ASY37587.1 hypothetical protein CA605_02535 [Taylorella equigenitalis]ASY39056.1 hypothetical protein CA604_02710 [Taylorella equigenitalis]